MCLAAVMGGRGIQDTALQGGAAGQLASEVLPVLGAQKLVYSFVLFLKILLTFI